MEPSSSKSVSETVNGSHRYVISGYSLAKGMGVGKYLASDTFAVGGYNWAVYFYPDGKNPEDNSLYVSAFVALASEGSDVRALFELTLVDQSGKGRDKVHSHFDRALESGPYTLKYRGSMWGYKRFYRRTSLESSDYLKGDCLVLNCTVGVVRNRIEASKHLSISVPSSNMGQHLKELFRSGLYSDIVFEVGEETYEAHKLVLAARSPVFKAQFFGLIGNPNMDKVNVVDVEPPVFKVRGIIQGASFWTCGKELIRVIEPLVKVLRMVDGNGSTSGYIYEAMDRAKEKIKDVFDGQVEKYEPFWKIIDERWNKSLHNDLHAAAAYLNPQFHFLGYVKMDGEVKDGLERVVTRMICDPNDRRAIIGELRLYHQLNKEKLFTPMAIDSLKEFHPRVWWDMWGGNVPILKRLAIKLLSQPSSSSGCERNWSAFEGAQSKKRTRLTPERLRDLVYIRMNELYKKKSSKLESEDTIPLDLDKIGAFIEDEEIEDDDYDEGEPGEDNDVEGEDEENVEDGEGNIDDFSFLDA